MQFSAKWPSARLHLLKVKLVGVPVGVREHFLGLSALGQRPCIPPQPRGAL